jgi:uncharacterized membrane protein (DUF4010 family)
MGNTVVLNNTLWLNLAVALGIGLLVGAERERSKGMDPDRSLAGIRTFAIVSLLGAVSAVVSFWLLIVSVICVTVFAALAYVVRVNEHPGLTTEITLVFTAILGGLAMTTPSLAASLAVTAAILLTAKEPIHGFIRASVSKEEVNDFLILAAATLIVLPLVPNELIGPFDAINPHNLWLIVILVMLISALGHLALRALGSRVGLPLVGLVSGFISSIATVGAMGQRAKQTPVLMEAAVAGALLSSLATVLQLSLLLAAVHPPTLQAMLAPLIFAGVTVAIYALVITVSCFHKACPELGQPSQTFSVKTAFGLAGVIAVALIASAALNAWFGQAGVVFASMAAGVADVHAAAISVASLAAAGNLSAANAVVPILLAFSINTFSKGVAALVSGGKDFAMQVIPGLLVQVLAAWMGWMLF